MKRLLKKLLSVSLCAALIGGTAAALPVFVPDSGITASAADTLTYGDFNYTVLDDSTIQIKKYKGSGGDVTIPSKINGKSVTSIGDYAFDGCSSLTSVTIPNSVTSIGNYAFLNCSSLTSVTIPSSVTSIGNGAFSRCSSLTGITIPSSVTSIGGSAFFGCSSLTSITIPSSVTSIENSAFSHCSSLTSITIPSSVTSIGNYAFYGCSSLTSVTIPNGVTSIENSAFSGCSSLTSVTIPNGVTSIGEWAFDNCSSLTGITIPSSVTSIGRWAFSDCSSLTSVTIPSSVTSIGWDAFNGCTSLTSITIPSSVTSIGNGAFYNCSSLTSIVVDNNNSEYSSADGILYNKDKTKLICCPGGKKTANNIPSSVTSIGDWAFSGCSSLTSVNIPSSVTSIGDSAFYNCSSLTSITIPSSVTSIGDSAFYDCSSLTSITIPSSVTSIGSSAFENCSSLTSITIPSSVTSIGWDAFSGCSSLTSVTIPDSVTSIGGRAFGYKWNKYEYAKIDGFTIYGKTGSYAETYANNNRIKFVSISDTALKNSSSISATTVKAGTEVTMTGKATGGTSPYKYAYYYKKSTDSAWTKAYVTSSGSAYTKYDSVTFKPTSAGTYNVRINVKDKYGEGTVVSKDFKLTVTADTTALANNSSVSATSVKANTEVTLTGKATGGTSPYKYAYYYKKSTESSWTKAYVTSSGSAYTKYDSVTFKPTTAGTYDVRINVKDEYGNGKVVSKDFKLTVTADTTALANNSSVSATSVKANTEVTLTGKATGGTSPYKYAYYYKKSTDSSWTKAYVTSSGSAYTKYDSKTFTPKTAGTYDVRINVRDEYGNGKTVTKDFKITVK